MAGRRTGGHRGGQRGFFSARVFRALLETFAVLLIASFCAVGTILLLNGAGEPLGGPAPWFAAVLVTVAMISFYLLHRERAHGETEDILAKLNGGVVARTECANRPLTLRIDQKDFVEKCERITDDDSKIMLVWRQAKGTKKYSTDSVRDQIRTLAKEELSHRVDWVVFTDLDAAFVAYQSFDFFQSRVLSEDFQQYRDAMNSATSAELRNALENMTFAQAVDAKEGPQPYERAAYYGFHTKTLTRSQSREAMIRQMVDARDDTAMLVEKKRKPIGVVRLSGLIDSVFGSMLTPQPKAPLPPASQQLPAEPLPVIAPPPVAQIEQA